MANLSQDLNLDIFNDGEDASMEEVTEAPAEELEVTPEEDVTEEVTEEATDVPAEPMEDVPADSTTDEDIDVDALVAEILWTTSDIDDKVEDIKDEASASGNEELLGMIDELQTLLAEKNQKIEELTKKDEITSGRLMDTYWDAENYSFYKPTIEKLENNPQLMMLVKNFDSDNEKVQEAIDKIKDKFGSDIIKPASLLKNTKEW